MHDSWYQPDVSWSESGRRFAVRLRSRTRWDDGLFVVDAATGRTWRLSLPRGEVAGFALISDDEAVVSLRPEDSQRAVAVYRATAAGRRRLGATSYGAAAIAPTWPPAVVVLGADRTLAALDVETGAERRISSPVLGLAGVARDGAAALAWVDHPATEGAASAFSIVPVGAGPMLDLEIAAGGGLVEASDLGLDRLGRFAVADLRDRPGLFLDHGRGAPVEVYRPPAPAAGGTGPEARRAPEITSIRISPDGRLAAFVEEAFARALPDGPGDWAWETTVDLVVVELDGGAAGAPRRFRLGTQQHWAVE
jgi:hypothetical protein